MQSLDSTREVMYNNGDDAVMAIFELFPFQMFNIFVAVSAVLVIAFFCMLIRTDRQRSELLHSWRASTLVERQALLDSLPERIPNTWRETVEALRDELDCETLGVSLEELPRARAKLNAIREGVPVHEKDSTAQIYERIRLTKLREQRRNVRHPVSPKG